MPEDNINLYTTADTKEICKVKGITFTNREMDVIACVICGKTAKAIANLLSINDKDLSIRSIETHIYNIRRKIRVSSKGAIIEFIEKSDKYKLFHQRYSSIILEKELDNCLIKIKPHKDSTKLVLKIDSNFSSNNFINQSLEWFIKKISFKSTFNYSDSENDINYIKTITIKIENNNNDIHNKYQYIAISLIREGKLSVKTYKKSEELDYLHEYNFSKKEDIYLIFFEVLKVFYPIANGVIELLEKSIHEIYSMQQYHGSFMESTEKINLTDFVTDHGQEHHNKNSITIIHTKILPFLVLFVPILIIFVYVFVFYYGKNKKIEQVNIINYLIPDKEALLERNELLQELKNKLKDNNSINSVILIGDRGSGKTTLARSFAHNQKVTLIWEVNSETEESIRYSFEKLASIIAAHKNDIEAIQYLKTINISNGNEDKLIKYVSDYLYKIQDWILIFDNVEDFTIIEKYYPNNNTWGNRGKILITTRNNNLKNNLFVKNIVNIGFLNEESALTLFNKIMKKIELSQKLEEKDIKSFLSSIPPFPLDVVIAAHYLAVTHSSPEDYLANLNKHDKNFNKIQIALIKEISSYSKTRENIIALTVDRILATNRDFIEPFVMISTLGSTNIPKILLNHIHGNTLTDDFIYNLKKHSLLSEEGPSNVNTFSIHRAIQLSILSYLYKSISKGKLDEILVNISKILQTEISSTADSRDIQRLRVLLNHAINFLQHKILPIKAKCLLSTALGQAYHALGYYHNEVRLGLEKHLVCLETLGEYKEVIVNSQISLAHMYRVTGLYNKAEEIYIKSMNDYLELKEKSENLAIIECCLGDIYAKLGKYKKARQYFNKTISLLKKGSNAQPRCLTNLGIYYTDIGEYSKAVTILEESIKILTQNQTVENPKAAWAYIGLGRSYNMVGDYDKAIAAVNHGIKLLKEYFPGDSINMAWANIELGRINTNTKNYNIAQKYFQQGYEVYSKIYGPEHILTSALLNSMAYMYLQIKDFKKCEKFANLALQNYKKANHPILFRSLEILGEFYLAKAETVHNKDEVHQYKLKAIDYLKEALDTVNLNFLETSEYILRIKKTLKKLEKATKEH